MKDLFQRQAMHVNKFNETLYNQKLKLDIEKRRFDQSTTHPALKAAIDSLCLNSYLKFKKRVSRLSEYELIVVSDNHVQVKSKKYINAIAKDCYRNDITGHFSCNICEACIAYEEQCEHSLVANNELFILSHFDKRHLRRDSCQGSYIDDTDDSNCAHPNNGIHTQDFLEEFVASDANSHDDMSNDTNNDQAGIWENQDISNSLPDTKALTYHEMKDLFDEILSKYEKSNEATKFKLGSIGISMKEIAISDGINQGIFESSSVETTPFETQMKQLVESHQRSFVPSENAFIPVNNSHITTSSSQLKNASKKRLMSEREKRRIRSRIQQSSNVGIPQHLKEARIIPKKKDACSFCGSREGGDNIKNCRQRNALTLKYVEYTLGANHNGLENLIRKMEHDRPFCKPQIIDNLLSNVSTGKGKHIVIHHAWSDLFMSTYSIRDMNFEISFLDKSGKEQRDHIQVTGQCFSGLISILNSFQKLKFIYDGTLKDARYENNRNNELMNFGNCVSQSTHIPIQQLPLTHNHVPIQQLPLTLNNVPIQQLPLTHNNVPIQQLPFTQEFPNSMLDMYSQFSFSSLAPDPPDDNTIHHNVINKKM